MMKFTAAKVDRDKSDSFILAWEDDESKQEKTETFTVYPGRVPGAVAVDLTTIGQHSKAMWDFFEACMDPAEFARFDSTVRDPKISIDAETLGQIIKWITEVETGRPTEQPNG